MRRWHIDTTDMLGFVADTIHPHGFDDLIRDNYAGMRELLLRKKKDT